MSYPAARYDGEGGLASATFRPADAEPEVRYKNGGTAHYLATGALTNGLFGLYRWEMSAAASGPDPHFHRSISESFYVLSGHGQIYDGTAGPTAIRATSCSCRRAASTGSETSRATGVDAAAVLAGRGARGLLRDAGASSREAWS